MLNKDAVKEILKVGGILFAITAIAALILALMNNVTQPIISKNQALKQSESMQLVLPLAKEFSQDNLVSEKMDKSISAIYAGKDNDIVGYAVMVAPNGYGGKISMVVGVDTSGTVTGVDIITQSETAGLGANCVKDEFKSQFIGKTKGVSVSKSGAKGNEIDAISSATITSKAVTFGVNAAIEAVSTIEEAK